MLQAKESSVHGLVKEAHSQLLAMSNNKKQYKSLLTDLTVQVSMLLPSGTMFLVQVQPASAVAKMPMLQCRRCISLESPRLW